MELKTGDKVVVKEDIKKRFYSEGIPESERLAIPGKVLEDVIKDRYLVVSKTYSIPKIIRLENYLFRWPAHFFKKINVLPEELFKI